MKRIVTIGILMLIISALYACKQSSKNKPEQEQPEENMTVAPFLISDENTRASCVYLTEDEEEATYISWVEIDSTEKKHFYFSKYDTEIKQFSGKTSIPIEQSASIHEEGMPKLTIKGDGSLFAMYETNQTVEGNKWGLGDLRYTQSFDDGKTWTDPKSVDPGALAKGLSSSFANFHRLADGEIAIAWLGTAEETENKEYLGRPIKFVKTQGKEGLDKPVEIDPKGCECCRTAVGSTIGGEIFIAYRNLLPGSYRDISFITSKDNGKSFEKPVEFSQDYWEIDGCPHNGPSITAVDDKVYAAYFTDSETHQGANMVEMDKDGNVLKRHSLSKNGVFAQMDQLKNGTPIVVYNETYKKDGKELSRILLKKFDEKQVLQTEVTPENTYAGFPVIQRGQDNNVVLAWSEKDRVFYRTIDVSELNPAAEEISDWLSRK